MFLMMLLLLNTCKTKMWASHLKPMENECMYEWKYNLCHICSCLNILTLSIFNFQWYLSIYIYILLITQDSNQSMLACQPNYSE